MNNVVDLKSRMKPKTLASIVRRETLGVDITSAQIYKLRVATAVWFDADDAIVAIERENEDYRILISPINHDLLENRWENFGIFTWFWLRHVKRKRVGKHRASSEEFKFFLQRTAGIDAEIEFVRTLPNLPEINPSQSM
jgi:hypothetical protein